MLAILEKLVKSFDKEKVTWKSNVTKLRKQ